MVTNLSIRKNWVTAVELMVTRPIILLPFIIIAFLEGLALELFYFSTRKPLVFITGPIIRKFSGEAFLHYPFSLLKLSKYFYYSQMLIYIVAGVFLTAISINILKNLKGGLPLKTNALIKNALNRYLSFVTFGIIIIALLLLLKKGDTFIFSRLVRLISRYLPNIPPGIFSFASSEFFFLTDVIMYTFLILALPIIVIEKRSLLKALARSIAMGVRNFFSIFTLIFVPFLLYFPIALLKGYSPVLVGKVFPELVLFIIGTGIVIAAFIDCFIIVCATQFLLTVYGAEIVDSRQSTVDRSKKDGL